VTTGDPKIETFVLVVFLILGLGFLSGAVYAGRRPYAIVKTWPTVEAQVVESELYRERTSLVIKSGRKVVFRYQVGGKDYTTVASSSYTFRSYKGMRELGEKYAPGTHHAIRYNPEEPSEIRFEAGYNLGTFFLPLFLGFLGVLFTGLGVVFLLTFRS